MPQHLPHGYPDCRQEGSYLSASVCKVGKHHKQVRVLTSLSIILPQHFTSRWWGTPSNGGNSMQTETLVKYGSYLILHELNCRCALDHSKARSNLPSVTADPTPSHIQTCQFKSPAWGNLSSYEYEQEHVSR